MAVETDIIERISDLLACSNTRSVKSIINEETFVSVLQEKASNFVPIASYYLNKEVMENRPGVFRCCEKLIEKCAEKGNPKECLIEFLAQLEDFNEIKFQILLKHVQTLLLRIPERKGPLMQCVFNTIYSFLNSLTLPRDYHLDSSTTLLLDGDENVQRIRDVYHCIVSFYTPFVNEICHGSSKDSRIEHIKLVLLQAQFHLLGNPIVFLDLEYNEKGPSALRVLALKIVSFILKLKADPLQFLTLVENKELITVDEEKEIIEEFSSNELKFSALSMSVFFYLIFSEDMCLLLPCVYDKLFVFQNCLTLAVTLLRFKEMMVLRKGLLLSKIIIGKIEAGSVHFPYLAFNTHKEVMELLSSIAVYHEVEENRKLAVELIKEYFFIFEPKAQFYILLNSSSVAPHANVVGFLTTTLTSLVRETFSNNALKEYFTGKRLFDLLVIFCSLKKGAETDLLENKSHIMSALNLIIFLTKRDKENFTGIWNYISYITQIFLSPLREAIDLSRAHFELQLKTLHDSQKSDEGADFAVVVGGKELDKMSTEEKKCVINSGLTVFDLIEHLLSWVNECIDKKDKD